MDPQTPLQTPFHGSFSLKHVLHAAKPTVLSGKWVEFGPLGVTTTRIKI